MQSSIIAERIASGLAYIKSRVPVPTLQSRISIGSLNIGHPCKCMMAQATNTSFQDARTEWGLSTEELVAHGFFAEATPSTVAWDAEYTLLTDEWKRQLAADPDLKLAV